ncbi:hypothetical protein NPX13_g11086 [Xylaria arbuscula]|uniref:Uncharacterized protein n=1 Tax=Xylaria arbuscula TaxID=114810 RepID=A0A9W8N3U0_9PEZI|nr:hypothetical protein NPX13_g11086 [Xylaria arbuscula]
MAGTQCAFSPDTATLEDYCEQWAQWVTELQEIKAQRTDQAELSAFQHDTDAIQAMIRQQRTRDYECATKTRWEWYRARLETHLRKLPDTEMLDLVSR